jgi:hypothetical protein
MAMPNCKQTRSWAHPESIDGGRCVLQRAADIFTPTTRIAVLVDVLSKIIALWHRVSIAEQTALNSTWPLLVS